MSKAQSPAPSPLVCGPPFFLLLSFHLKLDAEIASYFPANDNYYGYFDPYAPKTFTKALDDLEAFIARDGPFDGVLAYSHGAQLTAAMLGRLRSRDPFAQPFSCAVFISGGIPYEFACDDVKELRYVDPVRSGVLVHIPTANIWGKNDVSYPGTSEVLSKLCRPEWNTTFVHTGGHNIPSSKAKSDLIGSVKAIRRTIDRALIT